MRLAVVGLGYVGLSTAAVLARHHDVRALDLDPARVDSVRAGSCPFADDGLDAELGSGRLALTAETPSPAAYAGVDGVVVATPTDFDDRTGRFDTSSVEQVVEDALVAAPGAAVVVRSTVPIGFTDRIRAAHPGAAIAVCPEFLREGRALEDALHPSRIVIGPESDASRTFAKTLQGCTADGDVPVLEMGAAEAEAVKLFSNAYLAMRVAYVNELDTLAARRGLDTAEILDGIGHDPRIGAHYNNPSFGYGGYCLPKDVRQLQAAYDGVPSVLVEALSRANAVRSEFVTDEVAAAVRSRAGRVVGVHRLLMKAGSDNFREASSWTVLRALRARGLDIVLYEPGLDGSPLPGVELIADLDEFKARSDLIVTNRVGPDLDDVAGKVYTRDVFGRD